MLSRIDGRGCLKEQLDCTVRQRNLTASVKQNRKIEIKFKGCRVVQK